MKIRRRPVYNRQEHFKTREVPYKPLLLDRNMIRSNTRLAEYEDACRDGAWFAPVELLPPWKRTVALNAQPKLNCRGLRIRRVDLIDETGFPTQLR